MALIREYLDNGIEFAPPFRTLFFLRCIDAIVSRGMRSSCAGLNCVQAVTFTDGRNVFASGQFGRARYSVPSLQVPCCVV